MSMTSTVSNTVHPEEYLHLVDTVISLYITQRIDIADMEYADLYQTGCLALCHAAATGTGSQLFHLCLRRNP